MERQTPLTPPRQIDGKPYYEQFGGCAVTYVGWAPGLWEEKFDGIMAEAGHVVTNRCGWPGELAGVACSQFPEELGAVVVHGGVPQFPHSKRDATEKIPSMLKVMDRGLNPVIFAPYGKLAPERKRKLLGAGYAGIAEYNTSPGTVLRNAAKLVTRLTVG